MSFKKYSPSDKILYHKQRIENPSFSKGKKKYSIGFVVGYQDLHPSLKKREDVRLKLEHVSARLKDSRLNSSERKDLYYEKVFLEGLNNGYKAKEQYSQKNRLP